MLNFNIIYFVREKCNIVPIHHNQYTIYQLLILLVPLIVVNNCYFTILTTSVVTISVIPVSGINLLGDSIVPKLVYNSDILILLFIGIIYDNNMSWCNISFQYLMHRYRWEHLCGWIYMDKIESQNMSYHTALQPTHSSSMQQTI